MNDRLQWALPRVLMALLGVWLVVGPYILGFGVLESKANGAIVGFFIFVLAMSRFIPREDNNWSSLVIALLGLWMIASPFLFDYSDASSSMINSIVVGVLLVILGLWTGRPSTRTAEASHH